MPDDIDNIKPFRVVPKDEEAGLIEALEGMVDRAVPVAKVRWAFYKASVEQGFTPEQALVLCQRIFI